MNYVAANLLPVSILRPNGPTFRGKDKAGALAGAIVWRMIRTNTINTSVGSQKSRQSKSNGRYFPTLSSLLYHLFREHFLTQPVGHRTDTAPRSEQNMMTRRKLAMIADDFNVKNRCQHESGATAGL